MRWCSPVVCLGPAMVLRFPMERLLNCSLDLQAFACQKRYSCNSCFLAMRNVWILLNRQSDSIKFRSLPNPGRLLSSLIFDVLPLDAYIRAIDRSWHNNKRPCPRGGSGASPLMNSGSSSPSAVSSHLLNIDKLVLMQLGPWLNSLIFYACSGYMVSMSGGHCLGQGMQEVWCLY